jgi:voltage-gated potassium channel
MKTLLAVIMQFIRDRPSRVNIMSLFKFLGMIATIVVIYGIIFHQIMAYEGREESWFTGVYWALTVMSTLGFGDITFESDLGRIFSVFVLVTGIILLVLLPFTFIEFFYEPYMKAQQAARTPTELPEKTRDHVILTKFDVVTRMLIERLNHYHYDYVLITSDINEASQLLDQGYKVMIGDLDDPKTYQLARVDQALFVASTVNDQVNANIVFTVREISDSVPIIATASNAASVDILKLAGASYVLQLGEMMGRTLARQVSAGVTRAHIIGQFDNLQIAEAGVRGTPLVGKTLEETQLGYHIGINVLGMWERGIFQSATPETVITPNMTMVMAGFEEHITHYNQMYCRKHADAPRAIIIGGGRVGRAVAQSLAERAIPYTIVERRTDRIRGDLDYMLGDGQASVRRQASLLPLVMMI